MSVVKRAIWLTCMLPLWVGAAHAMAAAPEGIMPTHHLLPIEAQNESQNGLSGPDQSPACAAAGGIGSSTDCRRNGVQINPLSGQALSPDDQCTSVGGMADGFACFKGNQQIDPRTGAILQQGDPGYEPKLENQPPLSSFSSQ